jgi:ribosomal-protein-alanine N-acetyltransferase
MTGWARTRPRDVGEPRISPIETDRLVLVSMTKRLLSALSEDDLDAAGSSVDFAFARPCSLAGNPFISRRLDLIESDPSQHAWMYRAVVRKSDRQMLGHISFHHKAPDPDLRVYSEQAAELGYAIEPEYRRQGYAKESAIAMMEWAGREHGVRDFILSISPDNAPSLALARSMGFDVVGEQMDDIDGLEYVMKATLESVLRTKL